MLSLSTTVQTVLDEYINLFHEQFPETLEGLYIHGSIALDAYVDDSSDIDFITITNRRLTEKDRDTLSSIHTKIADTYKKPEMDGVYITRKDIGKLYHSSGDSAYNYPYFNDNILSFGDYFNFNPITWWLFSKKGITVLGPEPSAYPIDINSDQLTLYVLENMNSYWANRIQMMENSTEKIINLPSQTIDVEVEWTVLGLLRQFYTLKEHDIISKLGAGEYGLVHLPEEWHTIIKDAIHIRKNTRLNAFDSDRERLEAVIGFSKYLIRLCNSSGSLG